MDSHSDSLEASWEEEEQTVQAEHRARTAANLAALDVVDALRHAEEQNHLAKAARREQSWREHQDDPRHSWRRVANLALNGGDSNATVGADAEDTEESLQAQQEPHLDRTVGELDIVEATKCERVADPVTTRTDRLPHSHRMANELHNVEQSLADASVALERKIAGRRRRCVSGDPGCMCLRLPKVSECIGTNDLRIWLDTLLKQQQHLLKRYRGVHSGSDKATLNVMGLKGLMSRASRIPGLTEGLRELTEQLHTFHAHLISSPALSTGSTARFKADAVKQMESSARKVGLYNEDLEDAVDDLLASWSQRRDVAPRKLATTAIIRAEVKAAKSAASLLVRRDIPRTECAIRCVVNGRHKMRSARLLRLSQPDSQRVHLATAKRTSIVEERRRRVGGNAVTRKTVSTERRHRKTTATGKLCSARHVQSARRPEVKTHPRASHKPRPPSKQRVHSRASSAPRRARRTKLVTTASQCPKAVTGTQIQAAQSEREIADHHLERHRNNVESSALPPYPGEAGKFFDDHQRIKSKREVQDAEIAQMRADEDSRRRAERATDAWGQQSDWDLDDEMLQNQRVADDQCLQAERDEEDNRAKLAYENEMRQQAGQDAAVCEQNHRNLFVSQTPPDKSTGSQDTSSLDSGFVSSSDNTAHTLTSVLNFGPDIGKTDKSVYTFLNDQLRAARAPHGRVALCTGTEFKDGKSSAAFTILESKRDTPQLLLGVAERSLGVEKDVTAETNRFWGISSLDGSIVSNGWHVRWKGQQGFCVGDTVELLVLAAAGNIAVKKNDKLLGVATIPGGVLPTAEDLCWAISLHDVGDTVTARSTDASQFETEAPRPTVSTKDLSGMHLRLNLLEAQLSARKQRRQAQVRELNDIHKQIAERATRTSESGTATEPKFSTKGASSTDNPVVVLTPKISRFGGPVATLGTSTRSGIGSIRPGCKKGSKAANGAVLTKLKQLESASAKVSTKFSEPVPDFKVLRSREVLPDGWALVPPDLAEMHKSALVQSLAFHTSGTWHSAEIADGFRIVNVANCSRGQKGGALLIEAEEQMTEEAVFSTVVAAVATDRSAAAANNTSAVDSDPVAGADDFGQVVRRNDLQRYAPYHFGEGIRCPHSPYGATILDVWYSWEEESLPSASEGLALGDWHKLLGVVKRRLGGYLYRTFIVGLAWETGASSRLRQVSTDMHCVPGESRASPMRDGVYPIVHAIFDQSDASGQTMTAPNNHSVAALKACVLASAAVVGAHAQPGEVASAPPRMERTASDEDREL